MQKKFENIGEFYGAGLFEEPDASLFVRYSRDLRRYLENITLPEYNGEPLYPCGKLIKESYIGHNYSYTVEFTYKKLCEKDEIAAGAARELFARYNFFPPVEHAIGGNMYTHSMPNFRRIATEGLDSYQKRVEK
ncbi:MAG: hypothetical protein IKW59_07460 [Clostridia bacterium]|nr:hypothetical protein [Clostridia bacterium]